MIATHVTRFLLLIAVVATMIGCGVRGPLDGTGPHAGADGPTSAPSSPDADQELLAAESAGGAGIELVLPFDNDDGCVLTRAYCSVEGPWPTDIGTDGKNTCSHRPTALYNDAYALDFASSDPKTVIVATAAGTVVTADEDEVNWGHHVLIDHGGGLYSLYGHLSRIDVEVGQRVRQSERLGLMGSTGFATGPHVHFALMKGPGPVGPFDAVVPEPLSGHEGFHEAGRRLYGGQGGYTNLPVGTLVKAYDLPDIHVVCGDMTICHVADWQAFADRRFFHDARDPLDRVITVSSETLACYRAGETVTGRSVRALIGCGRSDWLYVKEDGHALRRRIPFDRDAEQASYDALLRSWGFTRDERRAGSFRECLANIGDELRLRDGTLIELASDSDFYVVTGDRWIGEAVPNADSGFVRRVHRTEDGAPFMPHLYRGYGQVVIVPDDAVFTMTNGMRHGENVFGPDEASACRYGPDRSGGAEPGYDGTDSLDPVADGTDAPGPVTDGTGQDAPCDGAHAQPSGAAPDDPEASDGAERNNDGPADTPDGLDPADDAPAADVPSHTVVCTRTTDGLVVTVHGPVLDALHGGTVASPRAIQYGSDQPYLWDLPYAEDSSRASVEWLGEGEVHVMRLPPDADRFNLFVVDDLGGGRWFDLDADDGNGTVWEGLGDCRRDGTLFVTTGQ